MKVYIASSWKNQHAVEMLTALLREQGHEVLSFVENNHGENPNSSANEKRPSAKPVPFDEWCASEDGKRSFKYDTDGAIFSDLVIYIGPSGTDAWAEVGAAWGAGVPIVGLWAKGEQAGLMRRMVHVWYDSHKDLLAHVQDMGISMQSVAQIQAEAHLVKIPSYHLDLTIESRSEALGVMVVARIGGTGHDWAAYAGPANWTVGRVLASGEKLTESQASPLFPGMARRYEYRR